MIHKSEKRKGGGAENEVEGQKKRKKKKTSISPSVLWCGQELLHKIVIYLLMRRLASVNLS